MLTKPSSLALRALYSFNNQPGWDEVNKMLEDELASAYRTMSLALDEVTLRQLQGRVQFINEFRDLVRDARELLEKRRETTL